MATLTKAEMIDKLISDLSLSKKDAKDMVEMYFGLISETLVAGENVRISKFGKFTLRDKEARPGRNPKSGEAYEISARRVVTFRSGQKLRKVVAQERGEKK